MSRKAAQIPSLTESHSSWASKSYLLTGAPGQTVTSVTPLTQASYRPQVQARRALPRSSEPEVKLSVAEPSVVTFQPSESQKSPRGIRVR